MPWVVHDRPHAPPAVSRSESGTRFALILAIKHRKSGPRSETDSAGPSMGSASKPLQRLLRMEPELINGIKDVLETSMQQNSAKGVMRDLDAETT